MPIPKKYGTQNLNIIKKKVYKIFKNLVIGMINLEL